MGPERIELGFETIQGVGNQRPVNGADRIGGRASCEEDCYDPEPDCEECFEPSEDE